MERFKNTLKIGAIASALLLSACQGYDFDLPVENQEYAAGVTYNNKVDVLMMVDNSSSMDVYQSKLAAQIPAMVNALDNLGMDYRIAVTISDMRGGQNGGKFVGSPRVITRSTPNRIDLLKARVNAGNQGSATEQGLASLVEATSSSYLNGEGSGFLRTDAPLVLLVLTNEDDHSPTSVNQFVSHFDSLKGLNEIGERFWFLSFIGVTSIDGPCSSALDGVYKEAGLKYMEIANLTNGRSESVCQSSLSQAISNVQKRIVQILTDYHLGRRPKLETLSVKINNVTIPQDNVNGWEYIDNGFIVRFHGTAVPGANDKISINFDPAEGR